MAHQTYFQIQGGSIVADCMPETYEFIDQNLQFFHQALKPIENAISTGGPLTFISHENQWSIAICIEKSEVGRAATGRGIVSEGNTCPYGQLLDDLV